MRQLSYRIVYISYHISATERQRPRASQSLLQGLRDSACGPCLGQFSWSGSAGATPSIALLVNLLPSPRILSESASSSRLASFLLRLCWYLLSNFRRSKVTECASRCYRFKIWLC